jgi:hypothetical protein
MASLSRMGGKILSTVDKNAALIGGGLRALERGQNIMDEINAVLSGQVHVPDLKNWLAWMGQDRAYSMSILAIIGSELVKGTGIGILDKAARIIGKGAQGYLMVTLAEHALWFSIHSPMPGQGGSSGSSTAQGYSY